MLELNSCQAHQHDQNAQEYCNRGLLILAAEEHYKAAEAFKICIERSTDEHVSSPTHTSYNKETAHPFHERRRTHFASFTLTTAMQGKTYKDA